MENEIASKIQHTLHVDLAYIKSLKAILPSIIVPRLVSVLQHLLFFFFSFTIIFKDGLNNRLVSVLSDVTKLRSNPRVMNAWSTPSIKSYLMTSLRNLIQIVYHFLDRKKLNFFRIFIVKIF